MSHNKRINVLRIPLTPSAATTVSKYFNIAGNFLLVARMAANAENINEPYIKVNEQGSSHHWTLQRGLYIREDFDKIFFQGTNLYGNGDFNAPAAAIELHYARWDFMKGISLPAINTPRRKDSHTTGNTTPITGQVMYYRCIAAGSLIATMLDGSTHTTGDMAVGDIISFQARTITDTGTGDFDIYYEE